MKSSVTMEWEGGRKGAVGASKKFMTLALRFAFPVVLCYAGECALKLRFLSIVLVVSTSLYGFSVFAL